MLYLARDRISHLTDGRLLARNTLLNILGQGSPLLVAVFTIPILINGLGIDKFSILTLAWVLISYYSLFDLGIGRALTKIVAEKLGNGKEDQLPHLIWTSLFLMVVLGLCGTAVAITLSSRLVYSVLKIPELIQAETLKSFHILSLSITIIILTTGLRGILQSYQCFGVINIIRISMGVFTFLGPVFILTFSNSLPLMIGILATGRIICCIVYLVLVLHIMPELRRDFKIDRSVVKPLIVFGGWMTVSNVVSPIMHYFDRFMIGAWVSLFAVAYYTTPFEVITKLLIFTTALIGVLFPAFSTCYVRDSNSTVYLLDRGCRYIFLFITPIIISIVIFAPEGLTLWLGNEFAQKSTRVLQLLALGVFVNSLSQIFFTLIQGIGRPDFTAKLNLIELPFYILAAWRCISSFDIIGAAAVWFARISVDAVFLYLMTQRLFSNTTIFLQRLPIIIGVTLCILMGSMLLDTFPIKVIFFFLTLLIFLFVALFIVLVPRERSSLSIFIRRIFYSNKKY